MSPEQAAEPDDAYQKHLLARKKTRTTTQEPIKISNVE
jgi:hypothetical protein